MTILDLQKKNVGVLGYGQEGRAVVRYLMEYGIEPVIFDRNEWQEVPNETKEEIKNLNLNFIFGPGYLKELAGIDVAFRSPGIWRLHPDLLAAESRGLTITSQTKFFFDNCPAKIIGVTGTKGKGTTASLISLILKMQFQMSNFKCQTYLTGNIGKEQPLEIIDSLKKDDWVVYELSSFQLQDLEKSPHIAVCLMVTSEHLDVHKNIEEYLKAKSAIVKYQTQSDIAILNKDFPNTMAFADLGKGKKLYFSTKNKADCYVENGQITSSDFRLPTSELPLRGSHNWQNVCAAVLTGQQAGCGNDAIRRAVLNFKGLEHRLELVADKNGIKFYNDSFSTTTETAIAAIKSFTESLILILGGSSKNADFTDLGRTIAETKNIKKIILIGQETENIRKALSKAGFDKDKIVQGAETMAEIFEQIRSLAQPGDVILLSPACASFDMFKNYQDRGEQFKKFVTNFNKQPIINN